MPFGFSDVRTEAPVNPATPATPATVADKAGPISPNPQKDERPVSSPSPVAADLVADKGKVDLHKLYIAVAKHESGTPSNPVPCATKWHKAANNCTSIMTWSKSGKRSLKKFASEAEGEAAFISLWTRVYGGGMPTMALARKYSGDDQAAAWYQNVTHFYYE